MKRQMLRPIAVIGMLGAVMAMAFVNCSEVGFTTADSAKLGKTGDSNTGESNVVDVGDLEGLPVDDGNIKEVVDELEERAKDPEQLDYSEENLVYCGNSEGNGAKKVLICHYPPGNAAARHTLCIALPALEAHLSHGNSNHTDTLGACGDVEEPEQPEEYD